MRSSPPIERLVTGLKRLPGIGEKSATRLAFYILGAPDGQVQELADAIGRLKQEIVLCETCFDLTDDLFRRMTRTAMQIADQYCGGRLVSLLEGGYNVDGTARAATAHVETLRERV